MELTVESYKLLSSDKKDDIKMDIINHYRKHQFLYDCINSDYINIDLWDHIQRQFKMRWLDSILVIVRNDTMIQSWEKYISAIGTNLQRTILFKKMMI